MLPNLVFTPSVELYRQNDVLAQLPDGATEESLKERLLHSLKSGDAAAFCRFCASSFDFDNDSANYVIYPLVGKRFLPFRFAFCEKVHLNETPVTVVFFADRTDDFHSLMSPASSFCRDTTGMLIHDLLCLRYKRHTNFISPETLMLFGDFPLIAHAAGNTSPDPEPYCDLHKLTERIFEYFAGSEPFSHTEFCLDPLKNDSDTLHPTTQPIVTCPLEAYVYIVAILSYVFCAISDDHRICAHAKKFGCGVEVSFTTHTRRVDSFSNGSSNIEELCRSSKHLASLAKVASAAAHTFGIHLDLTYDRSEGILNTVLGVGYENMHAPVDFHYSDPYSITELLREVSALFAA